MHQQLFVTNVFVYIAAILTLIGDTACGNCLNACVRMISLADLSCRVFLPH